MSLKMRSNIMLFITAFIWGTAFVAQKSGMDYVEPFTFNGIRTLIGAVVLTPVIIVMDRHIYLVELLLHALIIRHMDIRI